MTIQLVGVGLGRTGTHSLKLALEHLLGGTCHHMMEVANDQSEAWNQAFHDNPPEWESFLSPYCAIVDWPGAGVWRELIAAFPDAPVLLSTRTSADVWYESAANTIFAPIETMRSQDAGAQGGFIDAMMARFSSDWDPVALKAAYDAHNEEVRDTVPAERLFEYQPGDGWAPLSEALGLAVPDIAFPHTNTTAEFRSRRGEGPT